MGFRAKMGKGRMGQEEVEGLGAGSESMSAVSESWE
jgi:hypothetical protein